MVAPRSKDWQIIKFSPILFVSFLEVAQIHVLRIILLHAWFSYCCTYVSFCRVDCHIYKACTETSKIKRTHTDESRGYIYISIESRFIRTKFRRCFDINNIYLATAEESLCCLKMQLDMDQKSESLDRKYMIMIVTECILNRVMTAKRISWILSATECSRRTRKH